MPVEQSWTTILDWCRVHAPVSLRQLRPAAGGDALDAAQQVTGRAWPDDLRSWYRLHDGAESFPYFFVLPSWMPLPLHDVDATWRMYQEIDEGLRADSDFIAERAAATDAEAGSVAFSFLPSFVPIGTNLSGCALFVDTRPGPRSGCVTEFQRESADSGGVRWDSVADMLADVADSLVHARPSGIWRPVVTDGQLGWDL